MSTNDRHLAALERAVESAGLDRRGPVGPSVVAGPSSARLEAARAQAREELESTQSRRDRVAASLDRLRRDRAEAVAVIDKAEQDASEATERRCRLGMDADAALERLTKLDTRLAAITAELEQTADHEAAADSLHAAVQEQINQLEGAAVSLVEQREAAEHLEDLARAASALGLHAAAGALASWSSDLSSGTAVLQPRAAALLDELTEVGDQWQEHGAGDLACAPAVIAAQTELDAAQVLLREIEAEAQSGGLGQRTRSSIDIAHRHRQSLEAMGRRADQDELLEAIDAESTALRQVGFDSILDYRIAMSTGGSGVLVDACLRNTRARVSQLASSLEAVQRNTSAAQTQLGDRLEQLRRDAEHLTGVTCGLPIEQALRGCLDTPSPVRAAVTEIHAFCATTRELLQRNRDELETLQDEHGIVERERSVALADAVSLIDVAEIAEQAGLRASATVCEIDQSLNESVRELAEIDHGLDTIASSLEQLAHRRYLEEDVRSFSEALIAAVKARIQALDDEASSVVIDDPLGGLDDDDALSVLDDLIACNWSAPVLFVTSRAKLISRLRRRRGQVRCIDSRRRDPGRPRWRRRNAGAASHT